MPSSITLSRSSPSAGHTNWPLRVGNDESNDLGHFRRISPTLRGLLCSIGEMSGPEKDKAERGSEIMDASPRYPPALEPDEVQTAKPGVVAPHHAVGDNVVRHASNAA